MSIKKLSRIRKNDPHFQREEAKYEQPLPSREYVLQVLVDQDKPVSFEQLCTLLDIHETEYEMFQRRLAAMERQAQVMRNRKGSYIIPDRASLIAGRVEGHSDGYGFLVPDDGGDDLFLDAKQMSKVLHRDRALAHLRAVEVERLCADDIEADLTGRVEVAALRIGQRGDGKVRRAMGRR